MLLCLSGHEIGDKSRMSFDAKDGALTRAHTHIHAEMFMIIPQSIFLKIL